MRPHASRVLRCDKLRKFARGSGSSEVIRAADMLLVDEDIRDGSLAGFLVKVLLDVLAIIAEVQFVDLDCLLCVSAEVELVDDALCTAAVGAGRLGEEGDKVFVDRGLDELLC